MSPEEEEERFRKRMNEIRSRPEVRADRERILASGKRFNYSEWVNEAGPAKPEELAEMEKFLRRREEEREQYYAWAAQQDAE